MGDFVAEYHGQTNILFHFLKYFLLYLITYLVYKVLNDLANVPGRRVLRSLIFWVLFHMVMDTNLIGRTDPRFLRRQNITSYHTEL